MSDRAARLAEVEQLSRKPHAKLHSDLLGHVMNAMDDLTDDDWTLIARKSPDRLVQALAMSGALAGYSSRSDVAVSGSIASLVGLSDSELEEHVAEDAARTLRQLEMVPGLGDAIRALTPSARQEALRALGAPLPTATSPLG